MYSIIEQPTMATLYRFRIKIAKFSIRKAYFKPESQKYVHDEYNLRAPIFVML